MAQVRIKHKKTSHHCPSHYLIVRHADTLMSRSSLPVVVIVASMRFGGGIQRSALDLESNFRSEDDVGAQIAGGNPTEFCVRGHVAPKYFLLGTPKSGTTYFFAAFSKSPDMASFEPGPTDPAYRAKEANVFGRPQSAADKDEWLSHYPACSTSVRKVAVDCSPGYFGLQGAPNNILAAYEPPLLRRLVFMVFLRNPMARTHSHYYQYLYMGVLDGHHPGCSPEQFPPSFQAAARRGMTTGGTICDCACDIMFSHSMYAASFERYFQNFMPSQFHVVPFNLALGEDIVTHTWKLLGMRPSYGGVQIDEGEKNGHPYASIEEELTPETLVRFRKFMYEYAGVEEIVRQLHGSGAHLFGYSGNTSREVRDWLTENWGSDR